MLASLRMPPLSSLKVSLKALVLKKEPRLAEGMYFASGCTGGEKARLRNVGVRKDALRGRCAPRSVIVLANRDRISKLPGKKTSPVRPCYRSRQLAGEVRHIPHSIPAMGRESPLNSHRLSAECPGSPRKEDLIVPNRTAKGTPNWF